MMHENKIIPATSPLFCNHPTLQNTTLLLHILFVDVNGPSATLKVTLILVRYVHRHSL